MLPAQAVSAYADLMHRRCRSIDSRAQTARSRAVYLTSTDGTIKLELLHGLLTL